MEESPDYAMDEFDRTNPFGEEFRPDAPTPAPSPEKSTRKEWGMPGPVEPEYPHESTLLQTFNQLITKYRNDPNYTVKSKKSQLHSYSVEELKKVRDGGSMKKEGQPNLYRNSCSRGSRA